MAFTSLGDSVARIQIEPRIGLIGDVHGDLDRLIRACKVLCALRVRVVVVLGLGSARLARTPTWVRRLSNTLSEWDENLYWIDGADEDYRWLDTQLRDGERERRITSRIHFLPHGWRTGLAGGHRLVVLGGGNGSHQSSRASAEAGRPGEAISAADLKGVGGSKTEILLGSQAPEWFPDLDRQIPAPDDGDNRLKEAQSSVDIGRHQFHRAVRAIRPELCVGSRYGVFADQTLGVISSRGHGFPVRAVHLGTPGEANGNGVAVLNVASLDLTYYRADGQEARTPPPLQALTPQSRGRWIVHSQHSRHLVDLDAGTVARYPGPGRPDFFTPGPKKLAGFDRCVIGRTGFWTMDPDPADPWGDLLWLRCSVIHHIEKAPTP